MRNVTQLHQVRFSVYDKAGNEHLLECFIDLEELLIEMNMQHPQPLLEAMQSVAGINAVQFMSKGENT